MSELAKHYDLAKHHAHVGRAFDTSEPAGVRYGFDFEFAQGKEETLLTLSPEKAQVWLDLIEETGRTPEGLGMAGHFLFIGRK